MVWAIWIGVTLTIAPSLAATTTTTTTGAPEYRYHTNETVYAAGTKANIQDQGGNNGDQIPQDVTGEVETMSVVNGEIAPVLVWHTPLAPGRYDIVIDANRNGDYDTATDGLDSRSPGFVVVADAPPTPPVSIPTLAPIGIIALIGLLCIIGMIRLRRMFN